MHHLNIKILMVTVSVTCLQIEVIVKIELVAFPADFVQFNLHCNVQFGILMTFMI